LGTAPAPTSKQMPEPKLKQHATEKPYRVRRNMCEPLPQALTGRTLLHPAFNSQGILPHTVRPQSVHQKPLTVLRGGLVVSAFGADCSPPRLSLRGGFGVSFQYDTPALIFPTLQCPAHPSFTGQLLYFHKDAVLNCYTGLG